MQDDLRFVVTILTIFAGILIRHSGMNDLRAELQRIEDRLVRRLDKVLVEPEIRRGDSPEI